MRHEDSLEALHLTGAWVTIGTFDGVHRGHQALIRTLVQDSAAADAPAVVITFTPHPLVALRGSTGPYCLTSPANRARLLGELGVDVVITLPFNADLAVLTADEFMQRVQRALGLRHLRVGPDFALGRGRAGNVEKLRQIGAELGYQVSLFPTVTLDGEAVSSSRIRSALLAGEVGTAARLLGRPHSVEGLVVHGDGRGRGLGFPTANLDISPSRLLPANGVYTTWAWAGGERLPAVTNIGVRPTFNGEPALRVEAHLLDIDRDLYGQVLQLEFLSRLRTEQRFNSIDELMAQIRRDAQSAREVFAHAA
ncbi:MAG TPA: bifunctional riboflavin kinase/FAD synthetase [Anaerolineaceae bacterium]|nr:bifunctional riboflavin kinase/FAD synthetase [Anaerolineaceae bacterium]